MVLCAQACCDRISDLCIYLELQFPLIWRGYAHGPDPQFLQLLSTTHRYVLRNLELITFGTTLPLSGRLGIYDRRSTGNRKPS